MVRNRLIVALSLCTLALASSRAEAQVKPFKITGEGLVPYGIPITPLTPGFHWAVGQATELGRYYGEGLYNLLAFTGPTSGVFSSASPFVFTAANGDQLAFTYGDVDNGAEEPGQVELFPADNGRFVAVWVAEFNPVIGRCTGRFSKVVGGSFVMVAVSQPFVLGGIDPVGYSWSGEGSIEFRKGR